MATDQKSDSETKAKLTRLIAPVLFVLGACSSLTGVVAAARLGLSAGLALFFCGVGAIGMARILQLLAAIEADLSAIRTRLDQFSLGELANDVASVRNQLSMGVFGLLGAPRR